MSRSAAGATSRTLTGGRGIPGAITAPPALMTAFQQPTSCLLKPGVTSCGRVICRNSGTVMGLSFPDEPADQDGGVGVEGRQTARALHPESAGKTIVVSPTCFPPRSLNTPWAPGSRETDVGGVAVIRV